GMTGPEVKAAAGV
ncbi:hypothetical protein CISIN_1g0088412mg, partial [Citrus sinensis]